MVKTTQEVFSGPRTKQEFRRLDNSEVPSHHNRLWFLGFRDMSNRSKSTEMIMNKGIPMPQAHIILEASMLKLVQDVRQLDI